MLYQSYFKKNKVNQLILNRKINWFFDIKSIIYNKIDNKLIKISNLIRTVGIHKTWNAVYYRSYMYFARKVLNKDFIINYFFSFQTNKILKDKSL